MIISLSVANSCKNKHLSKIGHLILLKKYLQYLVVPKKVRIIYPSTSKESTHNIAKAASFSLEYVI